MYGFIHSNSFANGSGRARDGRAIQQRLPFLESLGASRLYENVFSHSFRSDQQLSKATEIIHTSPMYQKLVHFPEMSIGSIFTASSCMKDEILVPRKQRLDEGGVPSSS